MPEFAFPFDGDRKNYACDARPIGSGGYAVVFPATYKPSGTRIAFKRVRKGVNRDEARRRMKREVTAMHRLADEPNVMPVLDASSRFAWYVMPIAEADAYASRGQLQDEQLVAMLNEVCTGVAAAHAAGYVHRDITPHNILYLDNEGGARWVLADWGLVRALDGTESTLTSTGAVVGTEGFIAPEVLRGSAEASALSDVYSLGRVVAWATTGEVPLAGQDLLPSGPFRQVVRAATRSAPRERCTLDEFRSKLAEIRFSPPPQPTEQARRLRDAARVGEARAATELMELADENADDSELFLDVAATLDRAEMAEFISAEPEAAGRIAAAMSRHLREDFHGNFDHMNVPLRFVWDIVAVAAASGDFGLLEDASIALFEAEAYCARYEQRRRTRAWLERLYGPAAAAVARALAAVPAGAAWYLEEEWSPSRSSDPEIRGALHAAVTAEP